MVGWFFWTEAASPLRGKYAEPVDRESAYELLAARMRQEAEND